jgi:hypothetical protein
LKNAKIYKLGKNDYCVVDQGTEGERLYGPLTLIVLEEEDLEKELGPVKKTN